ncbi:DUF2878 domain-containing protein [Methyloradius palustris]|uniref:Membrane protein n=1 Tax=Methyloradius palustris TaxID=2778876 RepID=A0A8D5JWI8_9PROT|nr:DUF2878 domain-containing protein [Methyloradius palustris]BCM25139.1 membrane protein [Methyloradius palustris]
MGKLWINILGFQVAWFACVLGAANGLPWLGPLATLPVAALHLFQAKAKRAELLLMLFTVTVGSVFDQSLLTAGLIHYPQTTMPEYLLPLWMLALWLGFSTTLNVSLRWMRQHVAIASLFGLIGGPLAYISGQKLGAMQLLEFNTLMIVLAIGWALIVPALLLISTKLDGYAETNDGAAHV